MEAVTKLKTYTVEEALKASIEYFGGDEMAAEVWLRKYGLKDMLGNLYELTPADMHKRLASEFYRIEKNHPNSMSEELIFSLLEKFKYIVPGGSPMAGIGNDFQIISISNCFVIGNDEDCDSYGGILNLDQQLVQLQKRRAGVGIDLSFIRPAGSMVKNSALTSTGIIPFMDRFSNSTREVAQGGRRGALMETIHIKHPDSEKFIDAKLEDGKVTGANISVKIDDDFMRAALSEKSYVQQYPIESESPTFKDNVNAKDIWDKIIHNAWKSAEPGILFWDTLIRESVADCYADLGYKTVSTNPCGEIPLCPMDSCRLLSLNLFSYVENPFTSQAKFNFEKFKKHVVYAQRMMDNLVQLELEKIDKIIEKINNDPEPKKIKEIELQMWLEIAKKARNGRRTGLGITAEGDMLAALGITYGTNKAIKFSEDVHRMMKLEAYRASVIMAQERGAFPVYEFQRELKNPFILRIKEEDPVLYNDMIRYGRRNISLLTIAPTGSVSLMTQTTSGIEPVFLPVYKRRRKINPQEKNAKVDFVDKQGDRWQEYSVFHKKFEMWLEINEYNLEEVQQYSDEQLQEVVEKSPYYKATSNDVDWLKKVEMQGKIQKHIDHSISVTVNLPKDVDEDLVSKVYEKAWKSGCKGITVYRDGSREGVLLTGKEEKEKIDNGDSHAKKRPKIVQGEVIRFQNQYEQWIAVVGIVDGRPYEIFTGKNDSFALPNFVEKGETVKRRLEDGTSIYDFRYKDKDGFNHTVEGLSRTFNDEYWNYAKLLSATLRHRMPLESIVNMVAKLNLNGETLNTWKNGVTRVLRKFLQEQETGNVCSNCGADIVMIEGCEKCLSCGKHQGKCS